MIPVHLLSILNLTILPTYINEKYSLRRRTNKSSNKTNAM